MLNKIVKKLLLFILCFACAMPFLGTPISFAYANANYDAANKVEKTVFVATEYKFEVEGFADKNIVFNEVVVYAKEGNSSSYDKTKPIFKDGKDAISDDSYIVSFTTTGNMLTITFANLGNYYLTVQDKAESPTSTTEYIFRVVNDANKLELKYVDKTANAAKYATYEENILTALGTEEANELKLGKNFEVPSVEGIISTQIPYASLNKQIYYCVPGNTTYSSTSALSGTPKFKVSAYGTYVYYVLLSTDNLTDNKQEALKMTVDYLKEELDGFYEYKSQGNKVYYNKDNKTFYATEKEAKEGEGTPVVDAVKGNLIVPKFTFTLENKGPVIEITSTYQEKGYVGASYKISSITVNGSESTTYKLLFKAEGSETFIDVTDREAEKFDASTLTFTPSAYGTYYVEITAVDSIGTPAVNRTADIEVKNKYTPVSYKVGFADWLEKNTLPFVLLCVSGACLIAIICLLLIKPKDATQKTNTKKAAKESEELDR